MAEALRSGIQSTSLLQRLDGELICAVCLELYKTPMMLPCSHNFCKQCILEIIEQGMSFSFISIGPPKSFNCPICKAVINVDKFHKEYSVVNKTLENIVDLYKRCAPVEIFDSAWNIDLEVVAGNCKEHSEPEDWYCDSCSVTVCSQCKKTKHQSSKAKHRVELLKHASVSYQTEIADVLTDLKKKLIPLNDRVHQLENLLGMIQTNQDSINKKLEQSMSALMSYLRQQQEGLKGRLESEMLSRQRPITKELERCQAIKVNVQELIKKLSYVRKSQDAPFKLKLMKDTCKQLTTVLCFDIDACLQNSSEHDAEALVWDLNIRQIIEAIDNLDWKHIDTGAVEAKLKDTGMQTESEKPQPSHSDSDRGGNQDKLKSVRKSRRGSLSKELQGVHTEPGSRSPEQTRLDRNSFDEIDGDFPIGFKVLMPIENEIELKKRSTSNTNVTERRHRLNIERENISEINSEEQKKNQGQADIDEGMGNRFENLEITESSRFKTRSSSPMENFQVNKNRNSNRQTEILVNRTKKCYSDRDLNKEEHAFSPSNAEVLAKFVARRRTISPSKSSPTLKVLEKSLSDPKMIGKSDISMTRKSSFPALKCSGKPFTEVEGKQNEGLTRSLPVLISEGGHSEDEKQSGDVTRAVTMSCVSDSSKADTKNITTAIAKQSEHERDNTNLLSEKSQPLKTDTSPNVRNIHENQTDSEQSVTNTYTDIAFIQQNSVSTQLDITNTRPDISSSLQNISSTLGKGSGTQPNNTSTQPYITNTRPDISSTLQNISSTLGKGSGTQPNNTSTQPDIKNTRPDRPDICSTLPDISSTSRNVRGIQPDDTSTQQDMTSSQLDLTNNQSDKTFSRSAKVSDVDLLPSLQPKPFVKQPIGVSLDFNLGVDSSDRKYEVKRVTEV